MNKTEKMLNRGYWSAFARLLWQRTSLPIHHPSYVIFFFVAILIIGPAGVWIEIYNYYTSPITNLSALKSSFMSFIPAFVTATCLQSIWAEGKSKAFRSFCILILVICTLCLLLSTSGALSKVSTLVYASISTTAALWMWWIVNANQVDYLDDDEDVSLNPTGSDDMSMELQGDLSQYQT